MKLNKFQTYAYEHPTRALFDTMSFRVCIACKGIRVYPYAGFMTGQRYQCQDCDEIMVIPLEFENEADYQHFLGIDMENE